MAWAVVKEEVEVVTAQSGKWAGIVNFNTGNTTGITDGRGTSDDIGTDMTRKAERRLV